MLFQTNGIQPVEVCYFEHPNKCMTFVEGYITTVLEDAIVYSKHAGKKDVDADDVQLAIQSRLDHSYTNPPPREVVCF